MPVAATLASAPTRSSPASADARTPQLAAGTQGRSAAKMLVRKASPAALRVKRNRASKRLRQCGQKPAIPRAIAASGAPASRLNLQLFQQSCIPNGTNDGRRHGALNRLYD